MNSCYLPSCKKGVKIDPGAERIIPRLPAVPSFDADLTPHAMACGYEGGGIFHWFGATDIHHRFFQLRFGQLAQTLFEEFGDIAVVAD